MGADDAAQLRGYGRQNDDPSPTAGHHVVYDFLRRQKSRCEVYRNDGVPVVRGDLLPRLCHRNASVIDQNIDLPEGIACAFPPSLSISSTTSCAESLSPMYVNATVIPNFPYASAIARPMPLLPPVMRATLLVNSVM